LPAWLAQWDRLAGGNAADFLGGMRRAAEAGIVLDPGHADAEIVWAAAPIRGADGAVRGALGLALAAAYQNAGLSPDAQDALRRAADAISDELGWRNPARHDDPAPGQAERELLGLSEAVRGPAEAGTLPPGDEAAVGPEWARRGGMARGLERPDTMDDEGQGMKGRGA
jgi:hypothetical protein